MAVLSGQPVHSHPALRALMRLLAHEAAADHVTAAAQGLINNEENLP